MVPNDRPMRAPLGVTAQDDGLVVHDPHTGSTHRLNGAARHIWERCDGSRDYAALAEAVATEFGIDVSDAARDVDSALAQFRDAGLILTSTAPAPVQELLMRAVSTALGTTGSPAPPQDRDVDWNALVHLAVDHGVMP